MRHWCQSGSNSLAYRHGYMPYKATTIRGKHLATEDSVKQHLSAVVASIESLLADIQGNAAKDSKQSDEVKQLVKDIQKQLNTVKKELLDYMSPKTVQTTLF